MGNANSQPNSESVMIAVRRTEQCQEYSANFAAIINKGKYNHSSVWSEKACTYLRKDSIKHHDASQQHLEVVNKQSLQSVLVIVALLKPFRKS